MAALEAATHPACVGTPRGLFCARRRERDGWPGQARPWRVG